MSEQANMAAHYEHEIPEGYEAKIEGNKVIIELKESEDERIRKNILALVKKHAVNHERCQMEIYLEKQKEQSFTHHEIDESLQDAVTHQMEDDGDVDDFVRRGIDDIALKYAMLGAQWQKEQNPTKKLSRDDYVKRFKALCDVYAIELPNREYDIYHLCDDLSKLSMDSGKQKPAEWNPNNEDVVLFNKAVITNTNLTPSERAKLDIIRMKFKHCNGNITKPAEWSEKDEARKERLISIVKRALHGNEYCLLSDKGATELITWLNALHERLKSQPKQEWSEDNENHEDGLLTRFAFYTYKDEPETIYLSNLFVDEANRGTGLGTKILKATECIAKELGANTIRLKVARNNKAINLYFRMGYLVISADKEFDWMEKNLGNTTQQSKQEWSKEDEDMLNSIIATCQLAAQDRSSRPAWHLFEMQEKFLKSLRPQQKQDGVWITKEQFEQIKSASYLTGKLDHWKPSKEQIAALNCAIQTMQHQLNLGDKRLLSLYNDLKKLM